MTEGGGKVPIKIDPLVNTQGAPETYLRQKDFDALVSRFGYNVYLDKIIPCPCKEEGVNSARLTCKNCYGTGFVLVERIQTKAWMSSLNYPTEYKDWSIQNIGTARITTLSQNPIAFMDRIIMYEEKNIYTELIYPIQDGEDLISFCAYPPIEITYCKLFQGENTPLLDIDPSLIKIDSEGRIILNDIKDLIYNRTDYIYSNKTALSIRYLYMPSFNIIDVTRNLITAKTDNPSDGIKPKGTRVEFPYAAIGRMSHLVLERGNLLNLPNGHENNVSYKNSTVTDILKGKDISPEFCDTEK